MKKVLFIGLLSISIIFGQVTEKKASDKKKNTTNTSKTNKKVTKLQTNQEKISYALGLSIANSLQMQGIEIPNLDLFVQGLRDLLEGKELALTDAEIQAAFDEYEMDEMEKQQPGYKALAAKNLEEGQSFLSKNKLNPKVTTTASGLQYEVLYKGTSTISPKATDTVEVHYVGTLIDGTKFDSSYDRGETVSFPLNQVIKGWTEGLQLMNVGDKYRFYIPSELAYGKKGAGRVIGPNAVLIFDVELINVK